MVEVKVEAVVEDEVTARVAVPCLGGRASTEEE